MTTFSRPSDSILLRQHLAASPMKLHQARALLADRGGLAVSAMSDNEVIDYIQQHGNEVFALGYVNCNCFLGEEMTQILAVGPLSAATAKLQADSALAITEGVLAERKWPRGELHNGRADAFRHCCWSCLMTKTIGSFYARIVGETHECCSVNPNSERAMDLYNNRVGRSVGAGILALFKGDCKADCLQALDDGRLITSLGGAAANPIKGGY